MGSHRTAVRTLRARTSKADFATEESRGSSGAIAEQGERINMKELLGVMVEEAREEHLVR